MQIQSLLFFSFFLFATRLMSQTNCGCDHIINQSGIYTQSTTAGTFNRNILPGQTVCIMAGNYNLLRFKNFVGAATQPIIFKNCGGLVTIGHGSYYAALDFQNCRYFRATGTGEPTINYGFRVDSCGTASAMSVGALSSDAEVDHIEIAKAGFAGIMVKTDPDCNPATWRDQFTMYNVNIHDNYVHDVGGEGFYVGNSFFSTGMTFPCVGVSTTAFPHNIMNLQIHHNKVRRSGAECLQYACAPDAQVHDNDLDTCGISPFAAYQNNGLQCGGGAGGDCYNNRIKNVAGSGLAIIGHLGNNRFYNNLIVNCGGDAIFCDDRAGSLSNTYCDFINNTIIQSGRDAIRLYNQNNSILLANNILIGTGRNVSTGTYIVFQQGATATQRTNYVANTLSEGLFTDTLSYQLTAQSPFINAGSDVSGYGINFDLNHKSRPINGLYDQGAYEFDPTALPIELLDFKGQNTEKGNLLTWITASETNNKGFQVERLTNRQWFSIGFKPATPFANAAFRNYDFWDEIPLSGVNYYRLRQIDNSGKETLSKVISIANKKNQQLKIIPNPVSNYLMIETDSTDKFQIFNFLGQQVLTGNTTEGIELSELPQGTYFLKVGTELVKFLKQ